MFSPRVVGLIELQCNCTKLCVVTLLPINALSASVYGHWTSTKYFLSEGGLSVSSLGFDPQVEVNEDRIWFRFYI